MNRNLRPLTDTQKTEILAAVLDWELDTPYAQRTIEARKASSRDIAQRFGVDVLQVGGIRSNMAAGRYGSPKGLRAKRRKARLATA